jgi:hypothetical protein
MYNPILALVKISILIFLLRFSIQKRSLHITIWLLIALNLSLMITVFGIIVFQCMPISYNWDPSIEGHCIAQAEFYVAQSVTTIVTDIMILILPFWIVMGLKMKMKMKIAVISVFFLGVL